MMNLYELLENLMDIALTTNPNIVNVFYGNIKNPVAVVNVSKYKDEQLTGLANNADARIYLKQYVTGKVAIIKADEANNFMNSVVEQINSNNAIKQQILGNPKINVTTNVFDRYIVVDEKFELDIKKIEDRFVVGLTAEREKMSENLITYLKEKEKEKKPNNYLASI